MIRPVTLLTAALAAFSGLYLYQSKQRTLLLDQRIDQVRHQIEGVRAHIGLLHADYADLAGPDRVAALASRYLALRPTEPTQYAQGSALAPRLPPIGQHPQPPATKLGPTPLGPTQDGTPPATAPATPPAPGAEETLALAATTLAAPTLAAPAPAAGAGLRHAAALHPPARAPHPPIATRLASLARPAPAPFHDRPAPVSPPNAYPASAPPPVAPVPIALARASGGSMLGDAAQSLPPPRPIAN